MQVKRHSLCMAAIIAVTLMLQGCGGSDAPDDLQDYVKSVTARPAGKIESPPVIAKDSVFQYTSKKNRDPFVPLQEEAKDNSNGNAKRVKEPLEAYALDSLHMVGIVKKEGKVWVLISAPDGHVFYTQTGRYLGKNDGRITAIEDKSITIEEVVPTETGFITRKGRIGLSEKE